MPKDQADRSSDAFEVPLDIDGAPGCPLLEAMLAADIDVMGSCRKGDCASCETPVLNEVPDHRDVILTRDVRAAGAVVVSSRVAGSGPPTDVGPLTREQRNRDVAETHSAELERGRGPSMRAAATLSPISSRSAAQPTLRASSNGNLESRSMIAPQLNSSRHC